MPLINFLLKHPDDIIPFGTESDKSLHWFGLTDGNLWLEAGKSKLYEYTDSFLSLLSMSDTKYVDYYLSRFIEDFTEQFEKIATGLPDESYAIAKNSMTLTKFQETSKQWLDETNEADFDQAMEKYDALIGWIGQRELTAGHLVGSPHIGFFKNKNKISIVWKADQRTKKKYSVVDGAKWGNRDGLSGICIASGRLWGPVFFGYGGSGRNCPGKRLGSDKNR